MPKKRFLKYPEYPGWKSEFRKYILENLRYPEEALKNRVEGIVYLSAEVDDNGKVFDIRVEKGLGFGCDEEAVRLVGGIQLGGVRNRGIRLKTRKKFRIEFKLREKPGPAVQQQNQTGLSVSYDYKKSEAVQSNPPSTNPVPKPGYSYTINLN